MKKDIEQYEAIKLVYSLLFQNNINDYKSQEWITDINFLYYLNIAVYTLSDFNFLSDNIKDKIYKILSDSREIITENYDKRVEVINNIIITTNSQIKDNSQDFYKLELSKRFDNYKYMKPKYDISNAIPIIDELISYDYIVLYTHNEEHVTIEDFINDNLNDFSQASTYYLSSINAIISECPELFNNPVFKFRVELVLKTIRELYNTKEVKKSTKALIKKIKKI